MKHVLRLQFILLTILGCTTIAGAAMQEAHVGVAFGRTYVLEENSGSSADFNAPRTGGKIPWGFWDDYAKGTVDGRTYAKVGDRLYTRHAVDRMTPSGYGTAAGARNGDGLGRSISPNFIEDVITTGQRTDVVADGVTRSIFRSGSVEVVTEGAGQTVISVNPFKY